jgi:phosphatidate cytidylyltransferase
LDSIPVFFGLDPTATGVLLAVALSLSGATVFRGFRLVRAPARENRRAWRSLGTWWLLFTVFSRVVILGRPAVALMMFGVSVLALRETLRLVRTSAAFPALTLLAGVLYAWGWMGWNPVFTVVLPSAILLLCAAWVVRFLWPVILLRRVFWVSVAFFEAVVGPSFVFAAASLTGSEGTDGSGMGWFLTLVILTEFNDIAQALCGRALGKRQLAPILSPGKTWEGAAGGILSTSLLALVLLPILTPIGRSHPNGLSLGIPPWIWSLFLGTVIATAGVGGDLIASVLKRRRGVKDAGDLLPAQGGVLDRFDSLAVTAPVFFILSYFLWVRTW